MDKIKHRIITNDSSCEGCSQNWQGECRIFCIPHTHKEAEFRGKSDPNCLGRKKQFENN